MSSLREAGQCHVLVPSRMQERSTEEKHRCDGDVECALGENMAQNPNFQSLNWSISEAATATGQKEVLRGPRDTSAQVKLDVLLPAQVITMETAGMDSSQKQPLEGWMSSIVCRDNCRREAIFNTWIWLKFLSRAGRKYSK